MPTRRMLSKRQCIIVTVVLPSLILPAFILLRMADNKPTVDLFMMPKAVSHHARSHARHSDVNLPKARPVPRPRPRSCSEYIWSGTCHDPCYKYNLLAKQKQRKQQVFMCDRSKTKMKTLYTSKQKFVYKIPFQDECLHKIIEKHCDDGRRVPNIVHYVWFGKMDFRFIHFLSFLSAHKIQNPCLILVHGDRVPQGSLWKYFLQISPKVIHVQRKAPKKVFKKKLAFVEHKADVAKLEILKEYGGIYLDTDEVLLKSVNIFRNNEVTLGKEYDWTVGNSVVIAKRNALFLKLWLDSYKSYTRTDGSKHSNEIPYQLAKKYKDHVYIADHLFSTPNSKQLPLIYSKNFDWSEHYGMHMYLKLHDRFYGDQFRMDTIRTLNTTAGSVARHVIYGTTDMCMA